MILILAASYGEGRVYRSDHKFTDHEAVIIFDMVDLPVLETYEFMGIIATNGFLTKPKLWPLWEKAISRLRLPARQDV